MMVAAFHGEPQELVSGPPAVGMAQCPRSRDIPAVYPKKAAGGKKPQTITTKILLRGPSGQHMRRIRNYQKNPVVSQSGNRGKVGGSEYSSPSTESAPLCSVFG